MAKLGFNQAQDFDSPLYTPGSAVFTYSVRERQPGKCGANVVVTGTVGSGKTASVGKPICNSAIIAGSPVFNIDPKRNLREIFRGMAKAAGMENDIK